MSLSLNDISKFGRLRKSLTPFLNEENSLLLGKIERALGNGFQPGPQPKIKRTKHQDLVNKFLVPKKTAKNV